MKKTEKTFKANAQTISSNSAAKIRPSSTEEPHQFLGGNEAKNIRMYETHVPGFCYLRNGEYRKKIMNNVTSSSPDSVQCSEKVKAILFTDGELDVYKTICLHLLGTHVQTKKHIQRKDGRLCSYIKAQTGTGNRSNTLQPISERVSLHVSELPSKYDRLLPRYILDIKAVNKTSSLNRNFDIDSSSDEESRTKKLQGNVHMVPIYINNEIRMIVNSIMEALEAVDSSKLKSLIDIASSPEQLRNILANEDWQEFIIELAGNPFVMKPTSYDFVMAHLMFDKIPEKGTLETVAQVLEVYDDSELVHLIHQIRQGILNRHLQLINSNTISRTKTGVSSRGSWDNNSKISTSSFPSSVGKISSLDLSKGESESINREAQNVRDSVNTSKVDEKTEKPQGIIRKRRLSSKDSKSVSINLENVSTFERDHSKETIEVGGGSSFEGSRESFTKNGTDGTELNKCELQNLSNSERILLGLKIASLKCKPINMHQFEGKKKIDLAAIINPIVRPHINDVNYKQRSPENHVRNFAIPERKAKKSSSKISTIETSDLKNLTRPLLANLRLEISETENKKRVNKFMATIT